MRCISHCSTCGHMCIHSPMFKKLSIEERIYIIFNDENIVEDEKDNSGVYKLTPEEMIKFVELGDKAFS